MCKCDLMDRLTAEQFDTSYAKPVETRKRVRVKPFSDSDRDMSQREWMFYHAGRFECGARDRAAVKANMMFKLVMDAK